VQALGHGGTFNERFGHVAAGVGLSVQNVVVEGRSKTPEPLLWAALGIHRGDPILGFSLDDMRQRVESIAWVQSATIERRLPGTLVVQLRERSPFAVWQNQGHFTLIDRNGAAVTDSDVGLFAAQLPMVVGAGAPEAAATLLDQLGDHPEISKRLLAAVRVGERRWNLRMKNGTDVKLPEGHETEALAKLDELQEKLSLLDRPLQVVDLRLPDRLVVRPQPTPAGDAKDAPKDSKTGRKST
jgi:cell division protein FtsQ